LQTPTLRCLLLSCGPLAVLALGSCAEGGGDDRPQSEVQISTSHHMFGFKSLDVFPSLLVNPMDRGQFVFTDRGVLNFFDDSSYTIARTSGTSGSDTYALTERGDLSLYVRGVGRDPTVLFLGGYSLTTADADLFFTDRVQTSSSPSIGLYYATKVESGQVELEGDWHLASLHVILDQTVLSPDNVARAAQGEITIAAGAPGTSRAIDGLGTQGTSTLEFGGAIQNLLQNGIGDGSCNLTIDYTLTGQPTDSRVFQAAAGAGVVLGLDEDQSDGEAGLVFLVQEHDAPASPADAASVAGTFYVGGYTAFIGNPLNPGSDAFVGVLTLTQQGGFELQASGHQGIDFVYEGTFTLASDGGMTVSISGTNETWFAAIDREYKTVVFVDDFQELRSNGQIELNIGIGVREKPQ